MEILENQTTGSIAVCPTLLNMLTLNTTKFKRITKRARKPESLSEMSLVAPWADLVARIAQHIPARKPRGVRHSLLWKLWCVFTTCSWRFNLSDPAKRKALYKDTHMALSFRI